MDKVQSKAEGRHRIATAALITEESDQEEPEEEATEEGVLEVGLGEAEGEEEVEEEEEVEVEEIVIEEEVEDDEGEEEIEIIEEIVEVEEEEEEVEIEEVIEEEEEEEEAVVEEEEFEDDVPDEDEEREEAEGDIKDIPKELHGSESGKEPGKISTEECQKEELREESRGRVGVTTKEEEEPEEEEEEEPEEEEEEHEEVGAPSEEEIKGQLYDEQNEKAAADVSMEHPSFCIVLDANQVKCTNDFLSSRHLADAALSRSQRRENLELSMGTKPSYGTILSDVEKKLAGNLEDHPNIRRERSVADGSSARGGEADGKKRGIVWSNAETQLGMQGRVTDDGAVADVNLFPNKINTNLAANKSFQQREAETREIEEGNEMEEEEEEEDEDGEDPDEVEESFEELPKERNKESISTMVVDTGFGLSTDVERDGEIVVEVEEEEGESEEEEDEEEPNELEEYSHELAVKQLYQEEPNKESVVDFAMRTEVPDARLFLSQRKQNLEKNLEMKSSYDTVLFDVEKEHAGNSGKRRKSRWEERPEASGSAVDDGDASGKKRKTRWSNDETQFQIQGFKTGDYASPEIQALDLELFEINKKLEALSEQKTENLLKRMLKRKAKLQSQEKPPEFQQKLYVPLKEHPDYNFIGLILGPNGQTHKEMEKKTGARIYIRGKGSQKKGREEDPSEKDDLHVLICGDDQKSVDEAVGMVENIFIPVNDDSNSLKKQQLIDLGRMRQQLMLSEFKMKKSKRDSSCELCGTSGHLSLSCPLTTPNAENTMSPQQARFLSELGDDGVLSFSDTNSMREPLLTSKTSSDANSVLEQSLPSKMLDPSNLYVGFLPGSMDHFKLRGLFSSFGKILRVFVPGDKKTGISKGYGFVKYADPSAAAKAIEQMNGYQIENKKLVVRVAGTEPSSTANSKQGSSVTHAFSQPAMYPSYAASIHTLPYTVQGQGQNSSPCVANLPAMLPSGTIAAQSLPYMEQIRYPASSSYQRSNYGGQNIPFHFHENFHYRPWAGPPSAGITSSVQPPVQSFYSGDIKDSKALTKFPGFRSSLNSEFGQPSSLFDSITRPPGVERGNMGGTEALKALTQFPGFRSSLNSDNELPRSNLFDFQ